eukprot:210151_1
MRAPVIAAWSMYSGQTCHSEYPVGAFDPPKVGETVGILLDFKSFKWNGCIRLFKNKQEINTKPFIQNLLSKSFIWEKIPPVSLYIGAYYKSKFQFTIKQFPWIPNDYQDLFEAFYTEKKRIKNVINIVRKSKHDNIDVAIMDFLDYFINNFLPTIEPNYRKWTLYECESMLKLLVYAMNSYFTSKILSDNLFCITDWINYTEQQKPKGINTICSYFLLEIAHAAQTEDIDVMLSILSAYISRNSGVIKETISIMGLRCLNHNEWQLWEKMADVFEKNDIVSYTNYNWKDSRNFVGKKLKNMLCKNCGSSINLKTCKGCMKVVYCSKKCQKCHWKNTHRVSCDRQWNRPIFYQILFNLLDELYKLEKKKQCLNVKSD